MNEINIANKKISIIDKGIYDGFVEDKFYFTITMDNGYFALNMFDKSNLEDVIFSKDCPTIVEAVEAAWNYKK